MASMDSSKDPAINVFFVFAEELRPYEPLVAYYCDFIGTRQILQSLQTLQKMQGINSLKLAVIKKLVGAKLELLEAAKPKVIGDLSNEAKGEKLTSFVLGVFVKCFRDEISLYNEYARKCTESGREAAFKAMKPRLLHLYEDFNKCHYLIQLMEVGQEGMPQAWAEKQEYCRFKAGLGIQCLLRGEVSPAGNPFAHGTKTAWFSPKRDQEAARVVERLMKP